MILGVPQSNPTPKSPLVSVVILSYRRPQYLAEALASVVGQTYPNLEILVVDNASDYSELICEIVHQYSDVRLIANSTNLGFTGGMNIGLSEARGNFIYLTEDDVVLDADCVQNLVENAVALKSGLMSGIMFSKEMGTIHCAGANLRLASNFELYVLGQGQADRGQYAEPFEVDYIPGAMMFAARDVWEKLRGFREDFFMYVEDVELCVRARREGFGITVIPSARVRHFDAPVARDSCTLTFHKFKNLIVLYVLHSRILALVGFSFTFIVWNLLRLIGSDRKRASALLRACWVTSCAAPDLLRERRRLAARSWNA